MTSPRVHLALFTVSILFSLNYIVSKLSMGSFSPLTFAWLRVAGSAIVLNLIVRGPSGFTRSDLREITMLSILGVVINQTFFLSGLALTNAHVAAILITGVPVFAVAAAIAMGKENTTTAKIGGIALAAAGALLVVGGEGAEGATDSLLGTVLLVLTCVVYGLFLVLSKPTVSRLSPARVIARLFAIGAVLLLPISALSLLRQDWRAIPLTAWIGLLLVIAGPTVGAYLLNAWALRHAESSIVAAYTYVQPVLTTILAAIFLREHIRLIVVLAAAMIFVGVWVAGRAAAGPLPE